MFEVKESVIESARDLLKLQGEHGNWNYEPYMHGVYNGMELVLSMVEGREPDFRKSPPEFLKYQPPIDHPIPVDSAPVQTPPEQGISPAGFEDKSFVMGGK